MPSPQQQALLMVTGGDAVFPKVVLLLGFEGTNGAITGPGFTDESPTAKGLCPTINHATITTSQFKFGASSLNLTGVSPSGLAFNNSSDWNFGNNPFTVEAWVRLNSVTANAQQYIVAQWSGSTNLGWLIEYGNSSSPGGTGITWAVSTTGSDFPGFHGSWAPSAGVWYHVAMDWDGTKNRLYVNGVMTGSSVTSRTIFNSSQVLSIGADGINLNNFFNGNIDELRITKGVARYASDAGFAVPTAPFPRHA